MVTLGKQLLTLQGNLAYKAIELYCEVTIGYSPNTTPTVWCGASRGKM